MGGVEVSGPVFVLIIVGVVAYTGSLLAALVGAIRRGQWGWVVAFFLLSPVAQIVWFFRARDEVR
jgi:hypothetical protein